MQITPQYRQEKSKRSSVFIGLGAAWVVLVVLGVALTILSAVFRIPGAIGLGLVVCASVIAGVFAAQVHQRGK